MNEDLRDREDLEYEIYGDEKPEPFMPCNDEANGGRWWEKDMSKAAQDLYGEPTIESEA